MSKHNIQRVGDQEKVKIDKSDKYNEYIISDGLTLRFSELLEEFLSKYFQASVLKPLICELLMFIFPNERYKEPMIKIVYPDTENFNNLDIRDEIEDKFKQFLVEKSENLEEFKAFRNTQKKFRFVIQRE